MLPQANKCSHRRIGKMNARLKGHCNMKGFMILDYGDRFWGWCMTNKIDYGKVLINMGVYDFVFKMGRTSNLG